MSTETKAKASPTYLRKRFERIKARIAKHGDKEGNDAEIGDLLDLCDFLFEQGLNAGNMRALNAMDEQLKEAGL